MKRTLVTAGGSGIGAAVVELLRRRGDRVAVLGGVGRPRDVAEAVVAISELRWVTGQILATDGGLSLWSPIDPVE